MWPYLYRWYDALQWANSPKRAKGDGVFRREAERLLQGTIPWDTEHQGSSHTWTRKRTEEFLSVVEVLLAMRGTQQPVQEPWTQKARTPTMPQNELRADLVQGKRDEA